MSSCHSADAIMPSCHAIMSEQGPLPLCQNNTCGSIKCPRASLKFALTNHDALSSPVTGWPSSYICSMLNLTDLIRLIFSAPRSKTKKGLDTFVGEALREV